MAKRTVLITGASTGIGRAAALWLDDAGWGVYAGVRSKAAADELTRAGSPRLQPVQLDVTVPEQIAEISNRLERDLGSAGLGALVNNAGIVAGGPLDYVDLDHIRQCFEVNTFAPIAMVQAFRDQLIAANGRVVMISSITARISTPNAGPYAASKAALSSLSEAMRAELRSSGVKVIVVEPGSIATPIWEKADDMASAVRSSLPADAIEQHAKSLARSEKAIKRGAGKGIEPDEVAKVIEKALTARFPRSRYLVGRDAKAGAALVRVLPDRLRTRLVRRI